MSSIDSYRASSKRHRTPWGIDEIKRLADAVAAEKAANADGAINWQVIAKRVGTRNRVQCYQRYKYVDAASKCGIPRHSWSVDEAIQLLKWHVTYGNSWRMYSACLPGRTQAEIKGKFLSLQRSLVSKNSDVWRIDEYAPYREHLRRSLCRVPCKRRRKNLEICVGPSSERQLQLIWMLRHGQRAISSSSLDRNTLTFPLASKDPSRQYRKKGGINIPRYKTL